MNQFLYQISKLLNVLNENLTKVLFLKLPVFFTAYRRTAYFYIRTNIYFFKLLVLTLGKICVEHTGNWRELIGKTEVDNETPWIPRGDVLKAPAQALAKLRG